MANLLDTIRQNNPALQPGGVTDQTTNLQTLLRAKSGKAVGGSEVAASNLGEQAAVSQTNNQLQNQVAPQATIQNTAMAQQMAGQQQQERIQSSDIAQQRRFDNLQTRIKTDQLLNDLERNKGQLDMQRNKAQMEQVGINLRMQNSRYIQDLQREGTGRRLQDQNQFNEALMDSQLGANRQLLEKQLGNTSILKANDRQFRDSVAQIDINTAYDMFKNDMAEQKQRSLYSGAGAITTAGVGAYGKLSEKKKDKDSSGGEEESE